MKIKRFAKFARHPIAVRFALSLPITGLLQLVAWQFGVLSGLVPTVLGIVGYVIADVVLKPAKERLALLQACGSFLVANRSAILRGVVCIAAIAYFSSRRTLPSVPVLKGLVEIGPTLGILAIAILATAQQITQGFRALAFGDGGEGMVSFTMDVLHNTAILFFVLWLAGEVGDLAYEQISANAVETTTAAVLLGVFLLISKITGGWMFGTNHRASQPASFSASLSPSVSLPATSRDIKYIAAHESGHALCYAALGRLPPNFTVAMNNRMDASGVLGFVSGLEIHHQLVERTFSEWLMLTLLAGKLGEARMHGETTLGSRSDHVQWIEVAHEYLSCQSEGIFYPSPRTELEHKHNADALHALQTKQLGMLSAMFDENMDIMRELVAALEAKRKLGRADMIPILERIRLPDGFPLPFGPFESFSPDWVEDSVVGLTSRHA